MNLVPEPGNRSILFDPRVIDGKTIVNRVKKRELGDLLLELY